MFCGILFYFIDLTNYKYHMIYMDLDFVSCPRYLEFNENMFIFRHSNFQFFQSSRIERYIYNRLCWFYNIKSH